MKGFTIGRRACGGLLTAILINVSPVVLAAPNLPKLDDAQLQGLLNTLRTEYEQYLSSGNPHLVRPSEAKPWPCKLTVEQLNKLAGTVNSDDDPVTKRQLINTARESHSEPMRTEYSKQTFYPVQATCKSGKLEGPVDFWVEYDEATMAPPRFTTTSHYVSHVRFTAKNGSPEGLVLKDQERLKQDTTYNDPATAEMMSKLPKHNTLSVAFVATWVSETAVSQQPMVTLAHVDLDSNGNVMLTTRTVRPFGTNRHEETSYGFFGDSTHKDSTSSYKDGKKHGLEIIYAGRMGKLPIKGRQTCWKEGEQIMADPCTVD